MYEQRSACGEKMARAPRLWARARIGCCRHWRRDRTFSTRADTAAAADRTPGEQIHVTEPTHRWTGLLVSMVLGDLCSWTSCSFILSHHGPHLPGVAVLEEILPIVLLRLRLPQRSNEQGARRGGVGGSHPRTLTCHCSSELMRDSKFRFAAS